MTSVQKTAIRELDRIVYQLKKQKSSRAQKMLEHPFMNRLRIIFDFLEKGKKYGRLPSKDQQLLKSFYKVVRNEQERFFADVFSTIKANPSGICCVD